MSARTIISIAAALAGLAGPAAARAAIPAGSLLQNPGAEATAGSPDGAVVALPGWTTSGGFTAIMYGAPGFAALDESARISGGISFFAGGPGTTSSSATQKVDVSGAAVEVDAGGVSATLSGYLGGYEGQDDSGTVEAAFQDGSGAKLGSLAIGPVRSVERGNATRLLPKSATGAVPAGTRAITVTITTTRIAGNYDDAYFDNLSLALVARTAPTPEPTPAPTGPNLLRNPGAELGKASASADSVSVPGWRTSGGLTVVPYGSGTHPSAAESARAGGGKNFFGGGRGARSTARQAVSVSRLASSIDARRAKATLSALLGGWQGQADSASVSARFLDAGGRALGGVALGAVTAGQRGGATKLLRRSATVSVPAGTRSIEVVLTAVRAAGRENDGYADNLSLVVN